MTNTPAPKPPLGTIAWRDLTVPDAARIRDFYSAVVGWHHEPQSMGDYDDYCMQRPDNGETVAGICHARGSNAKLPPQWLIYITVEDADASAEKAEANGGSIIDGPRDMGGGRFCVIKDPAGAVCALFGQ